MKCTFEKYIPDYLQLELSGKMLDDFETHLADCNICQEELEGLSTLHQVLSSRIRPGHQKTLLKTYRKELMDLFAKETSTASWKSAFFDVLDRLFVSRPSMIRFAQAAVLIIVGVFVGRFVYDTQETPSAILPTFLQPAFSSALDQEFLQKYFVETEILLLGIENNQANEIEIDDVKINQEIAKRLLFQTFQIQQSTSQVTDESVLNYLTSLELLLLEISNAENNEIIQAFNDVRNIVKETDLLQSSRNIQQIVNQGLLNDI